MSEKQEVIERLQALELRNGGSHEMLSAIARAIYEPTHGGWTIGACQALRDTLVRLLGETDTPPSDGGHITDELRKWGYGFCGDTHDVVTAIADRIDAEHEWQMADAFETRNSDENLENGGWVRLPKDADGEYIRVGDTVRWDYSGEPFEVKTIIYRAGCETEVGDGERYGELIASCCRHYHEPTAEDVLTEMLAKAIERGELTNGAAQTIAEYAAKFRLANSEE